MTSQKLHGRVAPARPVCLSVCTPPPPTSVCLSFNVKTSSATHIGGILAAHEKPTGSRLCPPSADMRLRRRARARAQSGLSNHSFPACPVPECQLELPEEATPPRIVFFFFWLTLVYT